MRGRPDPALLDGARKLAAHLPRDVAFVTSGLITYYSTYADARNPSDRHPRSALVDLIQGIYARHPERALTILRHRIFLDHAPSEMDLGMLKVAARRLTAPITAADSTAEPGAPETLERIDGLPLSPGPDVSGLAARLARGSSDDDARYLALARELAAAIPRTEPRRFDRDRSIAAILVSSDGAILAAGINEITTNRTFHAEVKAVQSYFARTRSALPPGTRVYSTLKPCRMCAGMIWHCAEDPKSLRVVYVEDDLGPSARGTVLDRAGIGELFATAAPVNP